MATPNTDRVKHWHGVRDRCSITVRDLELRLEHREHDETENDRAALEYRLVTARAERDAAQCRAREAMALAGGCRDEYIRAGVQARTEEALAEVSRQALADLEEDAEG